MNLILRVQVAIQTEWVDPDRVRAESDALVVELKQWIESRLVAGSVVRADAALHQVDPLYPEGAHDYTPD